MLGYCANRQSPYRKVCPLVAILARLPGSYFHLYQQDQQDQKTKWMLKQHIWNYGESLTKQHKWFVNSFAQIMEKKYVSSACIGYSTCTYLHNKGELLLHAPQPVSWLAYVIKGWDFLHNHTPCWALQAFPFIFQPVTWLLLYSVSVTGTEGPYDTN